MRKLIIILCMVFLVSSCKDKDSFEKSFEEFVYIAELISKDENIDFIDYGYDNVIHSVKIVETMKKRELIKSHSKNIEEYTNFLIKHHSFISGIYKKDNYFIEFSLGGKFLGQWRAFDAGWVYSPNVNLLEIDKDVLRDTFKYSYIEGTKHKNWYYYGLAGSML